MNQKNLKNNNMNALSELKRMPENKDQMETFAYSVVDELMSGSVNPIEVEVRLKILEDTIKLIRKDPRVKNLLTDEIERGNDSIMGANLKLKQRNTWKYDDAEITALEAKLKARKTLLQTTKGVDPDTGEIVAYQQSSEYIEIKL